MLRPTLVASLCKLLTLLFGKVSIKSIICLVVYEYAHSWFLVSICLCLAINLSNRFWVWCRKHWLRVSWFSVQMGVGQLVSSCRIDGTPRSRVSSQDGSPQSYANELSSQLPFQLVFAYWLQIFINPNYWSIAGRPAMNLAGKNRAFAQQP